MKNFAKIFLIYNMVLFSFSQNSEAGFSVSKEEIDENDQGSRYAIRQPNIETTWQSSSDIYCPLGILDENFDLFPNLTIRPSLESSYDAVYSPISKGDDDIPVIGQNEINFEEFATQSNGTCNISKVEEKQKTTLLDDRAKEEIQPNIQNPSLRKALSLHPENTEHKTRRKKNKKLTLTNPTHMDYTDQIALGQRSAIRLPKGPSEINIAIVETLIQKVLQEKIDIPVKLHVFLTHEERLDFHKAFTALVNKYPFPFTWSTANKGCSSVEGKTPCYILELSIASRIKERERVAIRSIYQIAQEDEQRVNWSDVFDVAMRSNFTSEDLTFKQSIKVRLLDLQGNNEEEILKEFQQFLEQRLVRDSNPFHIIAITFNSQIKKDQGTMLDGFLRKVSDVNVGWRSRGISFDPQNGSLYLCLDNTHRILLDLHGKRLSSIEHDGKSVKEAAQETKDFIMQAYETFKGDITVLTGRGNHINSNGNKGTLRGAFGDWMKDEQVFPLIKNYFPLEGEGGYKIVFVKTHNLTLKDSNHPNALPHIRKTIAQMVNQNKSRLRITLSPEKGISTHNREFNLMLGIYRDLLDNNSELAKLIMPISFESTPGEMKIIFNKQHPKSSSSFTFVDSHGSTSVFGTIR